MAEFTREDIEKQIAIIEAVDRVHYDYGGAFDLWQRGLEKLLESMPVATVAKSAARKLDLSPEEEVRQQMQGYVTMFYELARIMGIGACADSPKYVWENVMRPRLEQMFGVSL